MIVNQVWLSVDHEHYKSAFTEVPIDKSKTSSQRFEYTSQHSQRSYRWKYTIKEVPKDRNIQVNSQKDIYIYK